MPWLDRMRAIAGGEYAGALTAVTQMAEAVSAFAEEAEGATLAEIQAALADGARHILVRQVSHAPLVNLLNKVLFASSSETDPRAALAAVKAAAHHFVRDLAERQALLRRRATAIIPPGVSVITHSRSTAVLAALTAAHAAGRDPRVICSESRPLCEGRQMAAELAAAGIPAAYVLDTAIYAHIYDAEMALMGVTAISKQGLVGRIGTAHLALAAQAAGIPAYAVGDSSKIWPADLGDPLIVESPQEEAWLEAPPGVIVKNRHYDITPWRAVSGVVTEAGLMSVDEVQAFSRETPVHHVLQDIVLDLRLQRSGAVTRDP